MRINVKTKVGLLTILFMVFTALVLDLFYVVQVEEQIRESLRNRGEDIATNLANDAEYFVITEDPAGVKGLVRGVMDYADVAYCLVGDTDGRVLGAEGVDQRMLDGFKVEEREVDETKKQEVWTLLSPDGTRYYDIMVYISVPGSDASEDELGIITPDTVKGVETGSRENDIGWVRVGISFARAVNMIREGQSQILIMSVGMLVLAGLMLIFVLGKIMRPVAELIEGTRKVAEGDLDYKVRDKTNDEFGDLAKAFNKMTTDLQASMVSIGSLKESENRFKAVAETTGDWIWETDPEGRITYSSAVVEKILGYKISEVKGKFLYDIFASPEKEKAVRELWDVFEKRKPLKELVVRCIRKNQEEIILEINGLPIIGSGGELTGYRGACRDITQRSKAEQALVETVGMRTNFISMVSHELRTPLTAIREGIGIVLEGVAGELNDDQKDFLSTAKRNVDRLTRLINDVLDFTKLRASRMEMKKKEENVNSIIQEAVEVHKALAESKGLFLRAEMLPFFQKLLCDRDRIIQVITNLVSNALKFTREGGITVSAEVKGEALKIAVKDTGPGIDPKDISKLFQEFRQLGGVHKRRAGGTGLGLAISKQIIEKHGGRIWVESVPGEGSVFQFILPLTRTYKILLVDDDDNIRSFCADVLSPEGYSLYQASSGAAAMEEIKTNLPDLVIIDIKLPDASGYDIIGYLRENEDYRDIAVIAMSGYSDKLEEIKRMANVDDRYSVTLLEKPLDRNRLLEEVKKKREQWQ